MHAAVLAALTNAERAITGAATAPPAHETPTVTVALGDPQAPARKLFEVLNAHQLLSPDGWLRPDVKLVSTGDHFDFGAFSERGIAQREGLLLLAWLAAHSASQVVLLLGNHDLSRVGELITFDDATFDVASTQAADLYVRRAQFSPSEWAAHEAAFAQDWPELPSIEAAARDFSGYHSSQCELVRRLLTERRFLLAYAATHALVCHAGVTRTTLRRLGLHEDEMSRPAAVANAMNRTLNLALEVWDGTSALNIPDCHEPGSALTGGGSGILFHRPAHPEQFGEVSTGAYPRRYDPRDTPIGLTQVIGHIRDAKCRQLLGPWVSDHPGAEGQLRTLLTDGAWVNYSRGTLPTAPDLARILFVDGGLNAAPIDAFELVELSSLTPLPRGRANVN
jgi:Calcineurin-like phosphoesterase